MDQITDQPPACYYFYLEWQKDSQSCFRPGKRKRGRQRKWGRKTEIWRDWETNRAKETEDWKWRARETKRENRQKDWGLKSQIEWKIQTNWGL